MKKHGLQNICLPFCVIKNNPKQIIFLDLNKIHSFILLDLTWRMFISIQRMKYFRTDFPYNDLKTNE